MISHFFRSIWTAVRSFSLGLLLGLLLAPRNGRETREVIRDRLLELFDRAMPTSHDARAGRQNPAMDVIGASAEGRAEQVSETNDGNMRERGAANVIS